MTELDSGTKLILIQIGILEQKMGIPPVTHELHVHGKGIPMRSILSDITSRCKNKLKRMLRRIDDVKLLKRYQVVLNLAQGRSAKETADCVGVGRSTVYRVVERFNAEGEAGLLDRREENGKRRIEEEFMAQLWDLVHSNPTEHGWRRPTWTREMLVWTMAKKTRIRVHVATMSRLLQMIGARRGRPKPTVNSPWSKARKNRRLKKLQDLRANLPDDEVLLYEDEVDIHLNPKIGLDWMVTGQQKEVVTPGQNEKRYLAGALDVQSDELIWVEGERKDTRLFIELLGKLHHHYPDATRIHLILDNYSIHHTELVKVSLRSEIGQRFCLHFLPPYCPDHNKIERTWQDVHANVTRNHLCSTMGELMKELRHYLKKRNRLATKQHAIAA